MESEAREPEKPPETLTERLRESRIKMRQIFEEMKEQLHCSAGEIVYVGDNERKDFIGARAAGYITVKYRSGGVYKNHKGAKEYKADYEIDTQEEIFPLLEKLAPAQKKSAKNKSSRE